MPRTSAWKMLAALGRRIDRVIVIDRDIKIVGVYPVLTPESISDTSVYIKIVFSPKEIKLLIKPKGKESHLQKFILNQNLEKSKFRRWEKKAYNRRCFAKNLLKPHCTKLQSMNICMFFISLRFLNQCITTNSFIHFAWSTKKTLQKLATVSATCS